MVGHDGDEWIHLMVLDPWKITSKANPSKGLLPPKRNMEPENDGKFPKKRGVLGHQLATLEG